MTSKIRDFCERMDTTDSNTVAKTYTWGLDLSGYLQGAGGVGELLCVTQHQESSTQNRYFLDYLGGRPQNTSREVGTPYESENYPHTTFRSQMVNCAGGALGDARYIEPQEGASWSEVAKDFGFNDAKKVQSSEECDKYCGPCKTAVVMYIPKYHDDKNPFYKPYDPAAPKGEGYGKSKDTYDTHFVKRRSHCDKPKPKTWHMIRQAQEYGKYNESASSHVWPMYDPRTYDPIDPDNWTKNIMM